MKKSDRLQVSEKLEEIYLTGDIDAVIKLLQDKKEEYKDIKNLQLRKETHYYQYQEGSYDVIELFHFREENDDEYNLRMKKQKEWEDYAVKNAMKLLKDRGIKEIK